MRILFVADLHGSSLVFRKALRSSIDLGADMFVVSGDLSGKDLRPIVEQKDGTYAASVDGVVSSFRESELPALEENFANLGHYYFKCGSEELDEIAGNPEFVLRKINEQAACRIDCWTKVICDKLDLRNICVILSPGNDDCFEIDDVIRQKEMQGIHSGLDTPVKFSGYEVVTLDYSNPTPWKTFREASEEQLKEMITSKCSQLANPEKSIFNFHCPPFRTKIDLAPEIDSELRPVVTPGGDNRIHIGSKAIRNAIEYWSPTITLHGHVHESPGVDQIGRTMCFNPGSEYESGLLRAFLVDIQSGEKVEFQRVEG